MRGDDDDDAADGIGGGNCGRGSGDILFAVNRVFPGLCAGVQSALVQGVYGWSG